jgi:hypothetical protein
VAAAWTACTKTVNKKNKEKAPETSGAFSCYNIDVNFTHPPDELRRAMAIQSSYIENVLRHRMIAELSSELWKRNCNAKLEIFNSEVDDSGFDLVLRLQSGIRYVQVKQANDGKVPVHCSTRVSFSKLPGSCIVLITYNRNDLSIQGYSFFGNKPHEPMQSIEGFKASKSPGRRNADGERHIRPHYRDVRVSQFTRDLGALELLDLLFPSGLESVILDEEDPLLSLVGTWPDIGQTTEEFMKEMRSGWDDPDAD